jgi:hypothetical protein
MTKRQYDDEGDDILKDGEHVRVPMMLCDGFQRDVAQYYAQPARVCDAIGRTAGHRPGFLLMDTSNSELHDAIDARDEAYAGLEKRSAAAWRTPVADVGNAATRTVERQATDTGQAELARDSAFAELEKRSANAWRGGQ